MLDALTLGLRVNITDTEGVELIDTERVSLLVTVFDVEMLTVPETEGEGVPDEHDDTDPEYDVETVGDVVWTIEGVDRADAVFVVLRETVADLERLGDPETDLVTLEVPHFEAEPEGDGLLLSELDAEYEEDPDSDGDIENDDETLGEPEVPGDTEELGEMLGLDDDAIVLDGDVDAVVVRELFTERVMGERDGVTLDDDDRLIVSDVVGLNDGVVDGQAVTELVEDWDDEIDTLAVTEFVVECVFETDVEAVDDCE